MPKRVGHFVWHFSRHSIKLIMLLSVVLCTMVAIFVGRVSNAPLDISFAKEYVRSALHDSETGNYADMDKVVLYWPDLQGPLYLELEGTRLYNKKNDVIFSVDSAAISFSRSRLLLGRIMPKSIVLRQPSLFIERTAEGGIRLNLSDAPSKDSKTDEEKFELTTRIFGYIARPGQESAHDSIISRLQEFRIENARLVINDDMAKQSWSLPDFNLNLASNVAGMEGEIDFTLPDVALKKSTIHVEMDYIWDAKTVALNADLENLDIKSIAGKVPELGVLADQNIVVNAHVETLLDERFMPADLRLDISSDEGSLYHSDLSDDPISYKDLALNILYNYVDKAVTVRDTHVTLKDITLNAEFDATHTNDAARGAVRLWIDEVQHAQIDPLWPKVLRGDNSELWVVKRMADGVFKNLSVGGNLILQKTIPEEGGEAAWDVDIKELAATFNFEGMSVDYEAPLDKGENLNGSGRFDFDQDELEINVLKGNIGAMALKDGRIYFDKIVAEGEGDADIKATLSGKVDDVLRYISKKPIDLGEKIGMDVAQVHGQADLDLHLHFPAQADVKIEDFEISVEGELRDVNFPDVVSDLDLSGGPLKLSVKDGLAGLAGQAMLDKRAMDFTWSTYLESEGKPYKEKVTAKITADPNLRTNLGIDLSDFIEGALPVDVVYTVQRNGTAKADIAVDATPALFFIEPFDFAKKPGEKGSAAFTAYLKNGVLQSIKNLTAKGEGFTLAKSDIAFKQKDGQTSLANGKLSDFVLEKTTGALEFVFDKNGVVNIVIKSKTFDARPFMATKEKIGDYSEPPMKISVNAQTMITAPDETVRDVTMFYDIDGQGRFNRMEMDAKVGAGSIFVRFKPDNEGKRIFRMKSDDAGAMLKAFQLYSNIRGGEMVIYGEPTEGVLDRNIKGVAEITDFKVVDAPALTQILSVLSLTGIGDALIGEGLAFDKLEANFSWLYRKDGSLLVLKDGRTSGNSLGLLFDGTFDNEKHIVDVSGTVVPMSGLNEIIGSIPLLGDILTGGSGGIFAATYSIKGSSDAPEISVNPLSVLTPGIIRKVLFE